MKIVRGTTPTIVFTFTTVDVSTITSAIMTMQQGGRTWMRKTLSDAVVDENSLSWLLTQEETLALPIMTTFVMVNWLLSDGTRGVSSKQSVTIEHNHVEEVMT